MQRLRRPLLEVGHGLRQRAAGGGIVAAVEPQLRAGLQQRRQRTGVEPLHAGRPARRGQPLLDGALAQTQMRQVGGKLQRGGDGGAGVDDLVAADERGQRQVEQQLLQLHDEAAALLVGVELLAPDDQRRADPQCLGADDVLRLGLLLRNDRGHAGAQNAGLLVGDLRRASRRASRRGRARSA